VIEKCPPPPVLISAKDADSCFGLKEEECLAVDQTF
jgi:hypothetical protein